MVKPRTTNDVWKDIHDLIWAIWFKAGETTETTDFKKVYINLVGIKGCAEEALRLLDILWVLGLVEAIEKGAR